MSLHDRRRHAGSTQNRSGTKVSITTSFGTRGSQVQILPLRPVFMSALCQKRTLIDGVDRFASSVCGGVRVGKRIGRCRLFGLPTVTPTFSVLPDCLVRQGP